MSPQLAELQHQTAEASFRARTLFEGLPPEELGQRPQPDRWWAAECLFHLSLTWRLYFPVLRDAMTDARARGLLGAGPYRMDLLGRFLKWFLEPPTKKRMKTKAMLEPPPGRRPADALPEFLADQEELLRCLRQAEGLALDRIKIVDPFEPRIRYNLFAAFHTIAAHQRLHLWQAERALRA